MDYYYLLSYDFSMPVIVLLGIVAFCTLIFLTVWLPYVKRPGREVREQDEAEESNPPVVSEVSVVVYARNDGENMESLLGSIFEQELVESMEVIVVNDGQCAETHSIVGRLEMTHSNLYMTYAPDNSRNLSRRKLALTLGIKAARYEKIVFTTGNAEISSRRWLHDMAAPLEQGSDIVIGYAFPDASCVDHGAKRVRAFDAVWEAISWLSPAIGGHPTRGIGANLAYRRQIFFDNKGFSRTLNLVDGDDDIFVSEIVPGRVTEVVIAGRDQVGLKSWNPARDHQLNKLSRRFTGGRISRGPRMRLDLGPLLAWVSLGAGFAAGILGWTSILPAAASLLMLLGMWIPAMVVWRRTSERLNSRRLFLTVVPLLMWHPFYNLWYAVKSIRNKSANYTWREFENK